jgi:hypothetical protein
MNLALSLIPQTAAKQLLICAILKKYCKMSKS